MSALDLQADVKPHLNITSNVSDAELQKMLDRAEAAVSTRVGPLTPVTVTERVRPSPDGSILLSSWPVISVTSITPYADVALDLTDVETDAGVLTYGSGARFPQTAGVYTVVYQHGWAVIPADIEMAVVELVRDFESTQRGPGNKRPSSALSATEAGYRTPGAAYRLPPRVEQLLAPYRAPRAG